MQPGPKNKTSADQMNKKSAPSNQPEDNVGQPEHVNRGVESAPKPAGPTTKTNSDPQKSKTGASGKKVHPNPTMANATTSAPGMTSPTTHMTPPLPKAENKRARPSQHSRAGQPTLRARPSTLYVSLWCFGGLIAAGYLTAVLLTPDVIARMLPPSPTQPESNEGQRAKAKAVAQNNSLKQSLANAQIEIARLKSEALAERKKRERLEDGFASEPRSGANEPRTATTQDPKTVVVDNNTLTTRAKTNAAAKNENAETALKRSTPGIPKILNGGSSAGDKVPAKADGATLATGTPNSPTNANAQTTSKTSATHRDATGTSLVPPSLDAAADIADAISTINTSKAAPEDVSKIETSALQKQAKESAVPLPEQRGPAPAEFLAALEAEAKAAKTRAVEKKPEPRQVAAAANIAFGPAVVTPEPDTVGVVLAEGPSVDALRLSWSLLSESHSAALYNLTPRYTTNSDTPEPSYSLVAGPLNDHNAAERVCEKVRAKGIPCYTATYSGNAL